MSVSINGYSVANPFDKTIDPEFIGPDEMDELFDGETRLPGLEFGDGGSAAIIIGTKEQWIEFAEKLLVAAKAIPDEWDEYDPDEEDDDDE